MSADRDLVLKVLRGQTPDYFIFPNAAAFAAVGLDPDEVAAALDELETAGQLEREMIVLADEADVEQVPGGYRLRPDNDKPKRRKR